MKSTNYLITYVYKSFPTLSTIHKSCTFMEWKDIKIRYSKVLSMILSSYTEWNFRKTKNYFLTIHVT